MTISWSININLHPLLISVALQCIQWIYTGFYDISEFSRSHALRLHHFHTRILHIAKFTVNFMQIDALKIHLHVIQI